MLRKAWILAGALSAPALWAVAAPAPHYAHVFVIVDENKDYNQIMSGPQAPNIQRLARTYGVATNFYAETHPSEPNYVALVGGDTYGIRDDGFHTIAAPHLGTQLEKAGLSWKGYYESLPAAGSLAVFAGDPRMGPQAVHWQLYAFKHSGFMEFASVQRSEERTKHIVGFDALEADLSSQNMPAFALIVPNQCNDMHGLDPDDYTGAAARIPADCDHHNIPGLIARGDATVGRLVSQIQRSAAWNSPQNAAIVITFDEGSHKGRDGGHIPTIVMTNHGPRGVSDATPYTHYSLLRTIEEVLGIHEYLGHAREAAAMTALFTTGH